MSATEGLREALCDARVMFWQCLIPEHKDRRAVVTVEWDDAGIAHCTMPGCDLTSEHTVRFARQIREHVLATEATS